MLKHCVYKQLLKIPLLCILILLYGEPSFGYSFEVSKGHDLKVHGFLSQAYIKSDENNIFGNSDKRTGSFEYNEIGLNLSYAPMETLNFATQFLSRRAGESDDGSIKLDFALVDSRFIDKSTYYVGARLGRIKNPFGLYNDTRDVAFTRDSIIMPQSIYFERTRDISISSDGVELYAQHNFQLGSARLQTVVARPRVKEKNTELAFFQSDLPGSLGADTSYIARLLFDLYSGNFTIAYSHVLLNMHYSPDAGNPFLSDVADIDFQSNIFSLSYSYKNLNFVSEYALRSRKVNDLNIDTTGYSYYLQLIYRFNHRWNVLIRNDVLYEDKNDKSGLDYASQNTASGPAHSRYAKDVTVGGQYLYSKQWMFRLEAHSVNGTAWLPIQDNPDLFNTTKKWKFVSFLVAYRF